MDFVRGSINVYDIFVDPDGERTIAVITERAKTQNNIKPPPSRVRRAPRTRSRQPPQPRPRRRGGSRAVVQSRHGRHAKRQDNESTMESKKINDPNLDQSTFAQKIDPRRMVVGTLSLPYKAQVEEFRRALRAKDANSLSEYPEYRGFVVERRMLSLDGKTVERDWMVLDIQAAIRRSVYPRRRVRAGKPTAEHGPEAASPLPANRPR